MARLPGKALRKKMASTGKGPRQVLSLQDPRREPGNTRLSLACSSSWVAVTHTLERRVNDRTPKAFFSSQFTLPCDLGKVLNVDDC